MNRIVMLALFLLVAAAAGTYSFFCIRRLLKFYFPNHQAYKDRVMDSQEKEDLLNELGFDVAGSLDSVNFVFKDNDRLLSMDWYCTDRLVLMDVSRLLDSSNPRYTKYK